MKLVIEGDQRDFAELLEGAKNHRDAIHTMRQSLQMRRGRGHDLTVDAGRRVAICETLVNKLVQAINDAVPDKSTGTYEGSLTVGSDMPLVYGRPRQAKDRVKGANLRRRKQLPIERNEQLRLVS